MINCKPFIEREKMSNHDSTCWRGIILFTAGIIWFVSSLLHPSDFDPAGLFNPFWIPGAILIALAYFLIPFGVVGIQRTLIDQTSKLSQIGFVIVIIGSLASVLTSLVFGFAAPVVAKQQSTPTALFDLINWPSGLMRSNRAVGVLCCFATTGAAKPKTRLVSTLASEPMMTITNPICESLLV